MDRRLMGAALAVALAAAGMAVAQQAAAPPPPALPMGYLTPQTWPDAAKILPQAPATGSPREAQDQAVFKATRALEGSPRWALATNDVPTLPQAMLKNFSCAIGVEMTPQNAPKLTAMLSRVGLDAGRQVAAVKDVFKRKRPYLIDEGNICVPKSDSLAASPDYPSGHATWGWSIGLILAEIAPDRATAILSRARAFGESRVVCGVHSPSAVDAGRTNGGALVATLHGDPRFRADLEAARAEVSALRAAAAAKPATCLVETELVSKAAY
ncbi:phosphatase PAP2 family protein [Phenylobacterium sp.]|uniref:acid phosphatase n=1 Tax=Phenylobacterium sp. TaxID=1871053 RepID=UPI00286C199A|nr:phosphatase PAP2 family protein [Phenylobacterium sp.]